MKKYMFCYKSNPNEIIGLASCSDILAAISYFSLIKQLSSEDFLKIFYVKEYEREK